jgi:hemerythrin
MVEAHVWNQTLDVGHEAMDHDHHLQIALLSAVVEAIEQSRPWMASKLADQLLRYSGSHFMGEELLMEAGEYPLLGPHRDEHRKLVEAMEELRAAIARDDAALSIASAIECRSALAGHITGADRRVAEHVAARRPARAEGNGAGH